MAELKEILFGMLILIYGIVFYIVGRTNFLEKVIVQGLNDFIKNNSDEVELEETKHGKWIKPTKIADMMHNVPHCSICGEVPCDEGKYCPNCGAKMDGGDKP